MDHFIKMTFWMATLGALSSYTTVSSEDIIRYEDYNIEALKSDVKCFNDSKFYVPLNVQLECITAALDCVMKELNGTAKVECDHNEDTIDRALETLDIKIGQRQKESTVETTANDCECERWHQDLFERFLEGFESLVQQEKNAASG